jgi:uncharacterized protein YxeA
MKIKILVILFLLIFAIGAAIFFYATRQQEREFSGTFVKEEGGTHGNIHQAKEKSGFT